MLENIGVSRPMRFQHLVINRPGRKSAVDMKMYSDLADATNGAGSNKMVGVVLFRLLRSFCQWS